MNTNMASLYTSRSFQFLTPLALTVALAACGGGGSKDGAASTQSATGGPSADGRVAYVWDFEDATGQLTHKYSATKDGSPTTSGVLTICGDSDNPVSNCSVKQEAGKSGQALHFDPSVESSFAWISGGHSVSLCAGDIFQYGDPFTGALGAYRLTVAMWIRPDEGDNTGTYHLFGTGDPLNNGSIAASFHLRLVHGKLRLSLFPGKGPALSADLTLDSKTTISASALGDNWHHVAVTYDDLAVTMYIDGKVDATAMRDSSERAICAGHRPLYLGGLSALAPIDGTPNESGGSLTFPGVIDQLVFSNKAYTADEILKLAGGVPAK